MEVESSAEVKPSLDAFLPALPHQVRFDEPVPEPLVRLLAALLLRELGERVQRGSGPTRGADRLAANTALSRGREVVPGVDRLKRAIHVPPRAGAPRHDFPSTPSSPRAARETASHVLPNIEQWSCSQRMGTIGT